MIIALAAMSHGAIVCIEQSFLSLPLEITGGRQPQDGARRLQ
jgi:hypothetical protein